MNDANDGLGSIETIEGLRILALTQERRISRLETRAANNGNTSAELRTELAEARAELRSIKDRLTDALAVKDSNPLSWLNPLTWFEKASAENAGAAVKVFRQLFIMAAIGAALWYASTVIDRILDNGAVDARTPDTITPVEVTVPQPNYPDSVDAMEIDAETVTLDTEGE